jgi:DNA-binding MarR family transcriptional regulator
MNQLIRLIQRHSSLELSQATLHTLLILLRRLTLTDHIYLTKNYKSDICKELNITKITLTKQLKVLLQAGILYKQIENMVNEYNVNKNIAERRDLLEKYIRI